MKIKKNNEKGLTLIEVLLSITLLSIVMISFLSFFTEAFRFNSMNDDSIQAMNIARERQALVKSNLNGNKWVDITNEFTQDPENPSYYIQTDYEDDYIIKISIAAAKENGNFYRELHQVHVQIFKEEKPLSETYTYVELVPTL